MHVWYDPATMPKVAAAATRRAGQLDPANAAYFAAQEQAYLAALTADHRQDRRSSRRPTPGTPIAFTEDVAGYLTDTIGLVVKTPVGFMKAVEEGTDPAPADVAAERDLFTAKAVKVLLYNSQVTSPITQPIHDLAQQNGIPIVGVAETIPPEFHSYHEWQLAQLDELEQALAKAPDRMTDPAGPLRGRDARRTTGGASGRDLSVAFEAGSFVAILGPNGSGKTSLLRAILGLTPLSAGRVEVLGAPPRRGNPGIGYVPQHHAFDRDLPLRGRDLVGLGLDGHRWGIGRPQRRAGARWRAPSRRSRPRPTPTPRSAGCRAASSSACGSPRRSWATRGCCCATSRWPASTCTTSRRSPSSSAAGSGSRAAPSSS